MSAGGNSDATTSQIATISDRNEQYDLACDMRQHTQQAIKIAAETVTKPGGDKDRYLQDKTSGIPPSPTFEGYSVKARYLQDKTSCILPGPTFEGYSVKDRYLQDKTSGILPGPTFADGYSIKDRYLQDKTSGILPGPTFVEGYSVNRAQQGDITEELDRNSRIHEDWLDWGD